MNLLRKIGYGLRALLGKRRAEREMDEELRGYLDAAADDGAKRTGAAEARRAARVRMGSLESVKEEIRASTWESAVESVWRDVVYGFRLLAKQPAYSATAILTLALGIGVNATIFSLYNGVVLKPMSARDPAGMVKLYETNGDERGYSNFSYPGFAQIRDGNSAFSTVATYGGARVLLGGEGSGEPSWAQAQLVSANYFELLGADATLGRTFARDEDAVPDRNAVAILENGFWQQHFGGDPGVVGKSITLNSRAYTVIGIAPRGFSGAIPQVPDVWLPVMMSGNAHFGHSMLEDPDSHWLEIVARLKPGVTLEQAQAEMAVMAQRLRDPKDRSEDKLAIAVTPASYLDPGQRAAVLPVALLIMSAVGLVLLIACANVANLQLARGVSRYQEMGVRASLGASRVRLVRQLIIESLWLAICAGAVGLMVAWWAAAIVRGAVHPAGEKAIAIDVQPDWRVAGYLVAMAFVAGVAAGILPALRISRQDPLRAMRGDSPVGSGSGSRTRGMLVICQVSASIFLLVAAGLAVRSLGKARAIDPGFDVNHVVVVDASLEASGFRGVQELAAVREIASRARMLPGVVSVATARTVPLGNSFANTVVTANGMTVQPNYNVVSPEYFDALGIGIADGRTFDSAEAKTNPAKRAAVVIVSGALARKLWPSERAVGKQLRMGQGDKGPLFDVVGVANDVRSVYLWSQDSLCVYFLPALDDEGDRQGAKIFVRTVGNPAAVLAAMPGVVRDFNASVPVKCSVLADNLAAWVWPSQVGAMVAAVLGSLALLLAAVGVASVTAFAVSQRRREIGIRMALGADARGVVRLLMWQSGRLIAVGATIGLVFAGAASSFARKLLYGLSALDAGAFVGVTLLLAVVGFVACYLPARRAANVDPVITLRYE